MSALRISASASPPGLRPVQIRASLALGVSGADTLGTMPARPTWKGFLKISLVTVPVRVFPATNSTSSVRFNQLHATCQTRIQQKKWCAVCECQVDKTEIVKGYEFEKGRYVVLDDEDIAKARPESTRVINLTRFADVETIDPE